MKILCSLVLIIFSSVCYGASYQGKVTNVFAYNGRILVNIKNGSFDNPEGNCSTKTDSMPSYIDINTDYGKALLSIVLIAKTTEKLVWASASSNGCINGPLGSSGELKHIDLKG